jgi:hypothetical protein
MNKMWTYRQLYQNTTALSNQLMATHSVCQFSLSLLTSWSWGLNPEPHTTGKCSTVVGKRGAEKKQTGWCFDDEAGGGDGKAES